MGKQRYVVMGNLRVGHVHDESSKMEYRTGIAL